MKRGERTGRWNMVEWLPCEICKKPASPAALFCRSTIVRRKHAANRTKAEEDEEIAKERDTTVLCSRCVSLMLCYMTVARHGYLGDQPQSNRYNSHERRMQAHIKRIRMNLTKKAERMRKKDRRFRELP